VLQTGVDHHDVYHQLIQRSVILAAVAICVGVTLELSPIQLRTMGIAALFSDIPLLDADSLADIAQANGQISAARNFLQHPMQSSQMTSKLKRISPLAKLLMNQVHEELDGNGFPYGISVWRIHPLARILNFVETYLTLSHPLPGQVGILPSDALACLIYHARSSRFCERVCDAFIKCVSIYPVGSEVMLDNGIRAVVLRACADEQYRPAIVVNDQTSQIIDLRCCPYQITTPLVPRDRSDLGRLRLSKLPERIWRLPCNQYVDLSSSL
jgi:HD-GYP domain-containing protein (c-di-GMP phosphodiesterase class II)